MLNKDLPPGPRFDQRGEEFGVAAGPRLWMHDRHLCSAYQPAATDDLSDLLFAVCLCHDSIFLQCRGHETAQHRFFGRRRPGRNCTWGQKNQRKRCCRRNRLTVTVAWRRKLGPPRWSRDGGDKRKSWSPPGRPYSRWLLAPAPMRQPSHSPEEAPWRQDE